MPLPPAAAARFVKWAPALPDLQAGDEKQREGKDKKPKRRTKAEARAEAETAERLANAPKTVRGNLAQQLLVLSLSLSLIHSRTLATHMIVEFLALQVALLLVGWAEGSIQVFSLEPASPSFPSSPSPVPPSSSLAAVYSGPPLCLRLVCAWALTRPPPPGTSPTEVPTPAPRLSALAKNKCVPRSSVLGSSLYNTP